MALAEFLQELDRLAADGLTAFGQAAHSDALEAARVEFLGAKKGRLKSAQQSMSQVAGPERREAGMRFNAVKQQLHEAWEAAQARVAAQQKGGAQGAIFDPTVPGVPTRLGRLHPITQTIEELKEIMGRLGFSTTDGPEIEDEYHNFEALNIPREHPARDPLENFYLSCATRQQPTGQKSAGPNIPSPATVGPATATATAGVAHSAAGDVLLLRSQTSTVQIRAMEKTPPPLRIISLGRVYRPDTADATHYPMFHQMEGLWVDRSVTMADLKSVLRLFASSYLGADVHVRFRPSFFPFTEPSVEADYRWNHEWVEFGGAGMVDPNVLKAVGYDPEQVSGFAFGLGVERLCMRRHNITDIREFYRNDIRFLAQFA